MLFDILYLADWHKLLYRTVVREEREVPWRDAGPLGGVWLRRVAARRSDETMKNSLGVAKRDGTPKERSGSAVRGLRTDHRPIWPLALPAATATITTPMPSGERSRKQSAGRGVAPPHYTRG